MPRFGSLEWQLYWEQKIEPQIEYPLGGSSKKGSHVYFLLHVFWVIPLFDINYYQQEVNMATFFVTAP